MRKMLIVSHGNMSKGVMETLKFITADTIEVDYIAAYTETSEDLETEISNYFLENKDEEVVIFSDMKNGSVNQQFMPYMNEKNHLITGFNLPLVLSLALYPQEQALTSETVEMFIQEAKNELIYMNNLTVEEDDEDE